VPWQSHLLHLIGGPLIKNCSFGDVVPFGLCEPIPPRLHVLSLHARCGRPVCARSASRRCWAGYFEGGFPAAASLLSNAALFAAATAGLT
jgi:hypothetical protein